MDKEVLRQRIIVIAGGVVLATTLAVVAAVAQPDTGSWLDPFFSTLLLPALVLAALVSIALRPALVGRAGEQTLPREGWLVAWVYVSLTIGVAITCLMVVVIAALMVTPPKVTAFAEAAIALVASYVTLRLLVAIAVNVVLLKRHG